MKLLILLALTLPDPLAHSALLAREARGLCAQRVIRQYRPLIDRPEYNDKFKHCSMSCVLTLECGRFEAGAAGILKELWDVISPGDPDIQDWRADKKGIALVTQGHAKSSQDCFTGAHRLFPNPPSAWLNF